MQFLFDKIDGVCNNIFWIKIFYLFFYMKTWNENGARVVWQVVFLKISISEECYKDSTSDKKVFFVFFKKKECETTVG